MRRVFVLMGLLGVLAGTTRAEVGDKAEIDGVVYEIVKEVYKTPQPPLEYPKTDEVTVAKACKITNLPTNGIVNFPKSIVVNGKAYEVEILGESLFEGCKDVKEVYVPASHCSLYNKAFKDCDEIRLEISGIIEYVGKEVFSGTRIVNGLDLSKAKGLNSRALGGCKNNNVTLGMWLWQMADHVFEGSNIEEVKFENNECSYDKMILKFHTRAFCESKLKELRFPQRFFGLATGCIKNCENLERIIFPDIETVRPLGCVMNSGELEQPPLLHETNKVYSCKNLKEVVCLGKNPIQFYFFDGLLTDVSILDDYSSCVLKVPAGSEEAYRTDPVWGQFKIIMGFEPGEYTNINSVYQNSNQNTDSIEYYNIQGIKVSTPIKGQLYIRSNGAKAEIVVL